MAELNFKALPLDELIQEEQDWPIVAPMRPLPQSARPKGKELPQDLGIAWPPGFAGQLATFICASSYSPIKEVAIAATLAFLAGVCGRAFRTHTDKDLSLYMILVARSGVGKDGIHEGIPRLIDLANVPGARRMIRADNFASGPALHKALLLDPGFLNLQGEFGRRLKRMAISTDAPMQELRTVMTDAYSKKYLEGKAYSNIEKSLNGVDRPALSFLGETTPEVFLGALTPDMMEDGFMSRFLVISYEGDRPLPNEYRLENLEPDEQRHLQDIVSFGLPHHQNMNSPSANAVGFANDEAYDKLKFFELSCIDRINSTNDEYIRQMWNRAHLKALKVAGLLAVADNHMFPQITLAHATWAKALVAEDASIFEKRKKDGDIGIDDQARQQKLLAIMREFLIAPTPSGYGVPSGMREKYFIPRNYLQKKTAQVKAFTGHKGGATQALDLTLKSLVDNGNVLEVKKEAMVATFNFHGKCYQLVSAT